MLCFSIHLIFSVDLMVRNIDMQFSTIDVDNDMLNGKSCAAKVSRGGWWYVDCGFTNLNGVYGTVSAPSAIYWEPWQFYTPIKKTSMMIKRHP
jgi:hypothetical protein